MRSASADADVPRLANLGGSERDFRRWRRILDTGQQPSSASASASERGQDGGCIARDNAGDLARLCVSTTSAYGNPHADSTVAHTLSCLGTLGDDCRATTQDALLLFEAARRGHIPTINRRLREEERKLLIRSGSVFIFDEQRSGIKRWTDGLFWSPSRILQNFLVSVLGRSGSSCSNAQRASSSLDSACGDHRSTVRLTGKEVRPHRPRYRPHRTARFPPLSRPCRKTSRSRHSTCAPSPLGTRSSCRTRRSSRLSHRSRPCSSNRTPRAPMQDLSAEAALPPYPSRRHTAERPRRIRALQHLSQRYPRQRYGPMPPTEGPIRQPRLELGTVTWRKGRKGRTEAPRSHGEEQLGSSPQSRRKPDDNIPLCGEWPLQKDHLDRSARHPPPPHLVLLARGRDGRQAWHAFQASGAGFLDHLPFAAGASQLSRAPADRGRARWRTALRRRAGRGAAVSEHVSRCR